MSDDDKKHNPNIDTDYETSRKTYLGLMHQGQDAIDMMMEVARESEHPRAYEVLATLIKNVADVTDKLMDTNKKQKDLKQKDEPSGQGQLPPGSTVNNLFVGTTEELQRVLQQRDQKEVKPIENDSDNR